MMNFSDETVEKVGIAVVEKLALLSRNIPLEDLCDPLANAALSSLTLADLMQVEEVRAIIESTYREGWRTACPNGERSIHAEDYDWESSRTIRKFTETKQ